MKKVRSWPRLATGATNSVSRKTSVDDGWHRTTRAKAVIYGRWIASKCRCEMASFQNDDFGKDVLSLDLKVDLW